MLAFAVIGGAACVAAGYQTMSPTGQWYGRTFAGGAKGSRQLALTFDDGPNDPYTGQLLSILAKHNVRATFFVIGNFAKRHPEIVRQTAQAGHVLGNHTLTHPLLIFRSEKEIAGELRDCQAAVADAAGAHLNLFRPPFGGRRPAVLRIARKLGFKTIMWNVPSYDWKALPAAQIERNVARRLRGGGVILLHDGSHQQVNADRTQTVLATDRLIGRCKNEGFEFVTIPEMMSESREAALARP